jgi:hypothetical protein
MEFRSVDYILQINPKIKVVWVRSGERAGHKPRIIILSSNTPTKITTELCAMRVVAESC